MDSEAILSTGRHTRRADFYIHSKMAVLGAYLRKLPGVLEAVGKAGETHYTDEDLTIPETLESPAVIPVQTAHCENMTKLPSIAEAGNRVTIF
jgi:hypothetical protein